jgi:hypothetical protein
MDNGQQVTVQKTSKGIKLAMIILWIIFWIGVLGVVFGSPDVGVPMSGLSAVGIIILKIVRYWKHG